MNNYSVFKFIPTFEIYSKNDASIYVIDNGSKDDSILFLKENHPKINIISLCDLKSILAIH